MSSSVRLRHAAVSLLTMGSGVALAVVPAATISIASNLFSTEQQGLIAVAVASAAFAGQLAFAGIVESRLGSVETNRHVAVPAWIGVLAIASALGVMVSGPEAIVLCLALPPMLAALDVARGVSVAERLDRREWVAAAAVSTGAALGVLAGFGGHAWALAPLAGGILLATAVRLLPVPHRPEPPSRHALKWVLADTAITGVVYPLVNGTILGRLGPEDAVRFAAIATVSGSMAVPLNFLRNRLLKEPSALDLAITAGTILLAAAALVGAELLGVFTLLFGEAWESETVLLALVVACTWRAGSLATTLPFTALRRAGQVRVVTILRAVVSAFTFGAALVGLWVGSLPAVFGGLLVAELGSALLYEGARRRLLPRAQR